MGRVVEEATHKGDVSDLNLIGLAQFFFGINFFFYFLKADFIFFRKMFPLPVS